MGLQSEERRQEIGQNWTVSWRLHDSGKQKQNIKEKSAFDVGM